jgi:hypothetical protein
MFCELKEEGSQRIQGDKECYSLAE